MKINQDTIIKMFVFFGPIGNLIPVTPMIHSFRFYYLLLPVGVFMLFLKMKENFAVKKTIKICFPLTLYTICSAFFAEIFQQISFDDPNNPVIRLILLLSLFFFAVLASGRVSEYNEREKTQLIFLYLKGYMISLLCGYVFFIGYYQNLFSLGFLEKFHVLLQIGYGILRFSPGSYANEYGIVSSFVLSVITVLVARKNKLNFVYDKLFRHKMFLYITWLLTLTALFLTTTRAAYIAYFFTIVYLCVESSGAYLLVKRVIKVALMGSLILCFVQVFVYNVLDIFSIGYHSLYLRNDDSSAYQRIMAWNEASEEFGENFMFGLGFGMANNIHNIYLQYLFEGGLIGLFLLFATGTLLICYWPRSDGGVNSYFFAIVKRIGIIHVLWFGMSNHNINHHLTWFIVLMGCAYWKSKKPIEMI